MPKTPFEPKRHGYHYSNGYKNHMWGSSDKYATGGRCGGMSFLALDHYNAKIPVPTHDKPYFQKLYNDNNRSYPDDGSMLADSTLSRLLDTFESNGDEWLNVYGLCPVKDAVNSLLSPNEKPELTQFMVRHIAKIKASIDANEPICLGLVGSKTLSEIGKGHQVVCYGYEYTANPDEIVFLIWDCNYPDQDVKAKTSQSNPLGLEYFEGGTDKWVGFFGNDYSSQGPCYWDVVLAAGIRFSKQEIKEGAGVSIEFKLKNVGEFEARVDGVRIIEVDESGNEKEEIINKQLALKLKAGDTYSFAHSFPVFARNGKALPPGWYKVKAQFLLKTANASPDVWYDLIAAGDSAEPRAKIHVIKQDESDKNEPAPADNEEVARLPEQRPANDFGAPEPVKKLLDWTGLDEYITTEDLILARRAVDEVIEHWPEIKKTFNDVVSLFKGGTPTLSGFLSNSVAVGLVDGLLAILPWTENLSVSDIFPNGATPEMAAAEAQAAQAATTAGETLSSTPGGSEPQAAGQYQGGSDSSSGGAADSGGGGGSGSGQRPEQGGDEWEGQAGSKGSGGGGGGAAAGGGAGMGLPAAKLGDKIVGVDLHTIMIPNPAVPPVPPLIPLPAGPTPHPYLGTITLQCSTDVMITNMPAATKGSQSMMVPPHLPIPMPPGVMFMQPPTNQATIEMGSMTVTINNKDAARLGDSATSCNEVGMKMHSKVVVPGGTVLIGNGTADTGALNFNWTDSIDYDTHGNKGKKSKDAEDGSQAGGGGAGSGGGGSGGGQGGQGGGQGQGGDEGGDDQGGDEGGDQGGDETTDEEKSWIEIQVVDDKDKALSGRKYRFTLPDGTVQEGTIGSDGVVKADNFDVGMCELVLVKEGEGSGSGSGSGSSTS